MTACLLCGDPFDEHDVGRVVCRACQRRLDRQLRELPDLYRQLGNMLPPGTGAGGPRVSGTPRDRLPVNEDVLDLRAWGGMVTALQTHEDDWRRALGLTLAPGRGTVEKTLVGVVDFLVTHLWWAAERYTDLDDLDRDVRHFHGAARSLVDPPEPSYRLGTCPTVYADGSPCGAVLRVTTTDAQLRTVTCRWCSTTWTADDWTTIRATRDPAEGAAA